MEGKRGNWEKDNRDDPPVSEGFVDPDIIVPRCVAATV